MSCATSILKLLSLMGAAKMALRITKSRFDVQQLFGNFGADDVIHEPSNTDNTRIQEMQQIIDDLVVFGSIQGHNLSILYKQKMPTSEA